MASIDANGRQEASDFNLEPDPRVLPMLGEINIDQWRCVAELVDNAVDGFLKESRAGSSIAGVAGRELGTIGGHVDELVAVGHVARRKDAGLRGLHVVANPDRTACVGLDAHLREAQPLGVGCASRRQDEAVGRQFALRDQPPRTGPAGMLVH